MKTKTTKNSVLNALLAVFLITGISSLLAGIFIKSMLFTSISLFFLGLTWLVELFIGEPDVYRNQ
jgi:hypothetical protein